MTSATGTNTLHDYLRVLSARKWTIVAVTLIAVAIGVANSVLRLPRYDATATLRFQNQSNDVSIFTPGVPVVPDVNPSQSAAANSRIVTRPDVINAVQQAMRTGMSNDALRDKVSATVQPDSDLVAIQASSDKAQLSARLANEFARQTQRVASLDARGGFLNNARRLRATLQRKGLDPSTQVAYKSAIARLLVLSEVASPVEVTRPAIVPGSPSSPKPVRDILLAAILGLLLGIGSAFLRNALDRRLSHGHDVEAQLGLPLLGYVPAETLGLEGIQMNGGGTVPEEKLEAFRILRTNAAFLVPDRDVSSVVVTSAVAAEGKSTVAAWYAYVAASSGRRTLLVDCDLRRSVLAERFGVEVAPGLSEYLAGDAQPAEVIRSIELPHSGEPGSLGLVPVGGRVFDPSEMIASQRFERFVEEVTGAFDLVIFDSAPLLPVSDTLQLVLRADAVLLCVRLEQTTRREAQAAKEALARLPSKPTGVVVTGVRRREEGYYYGPYSYPSKASRADASALEDTAT